MRAAGRGSDGLEEAVRTMEGQGGAPSSAPAAGTQDESGAGAVVDAEFDDPGENRVTSDVADSGADQEQSGNDRDVMVVPDHSAASSEDTPPPSPPEAGPAPAEAEPAPAEPHVRVDARLLEAALLNLRKRIAAVPLVFEISGAAEVKTERT